MEGSGSYLVSSAVDADGRELEYRQSDILTWILRVGRTFSEHVEGGITFSVRQVPSVYAGNQYAQAEPLQRCQDTDVGVSDEVLERYR